MNKGTQQESGADDVRVFNFVVIVQRKFSARLRAGADCGDGEIDQELHENTKRGKKNDRVECAGREREGRGAWRREDRTRRIAALFFHIKIIA